MKTAPVWTPVFHHRQDEGLSIPHIAEAPASSLASDRGSNQRTDTSIMADRDPFAHLADDLLPDHVTLHVKAGLFYSLVQETLRKQREEHAGRSIGLIEIGHAAWRNLTPVEQAHTLDALFTAYITRVIDEEREQALGAAAASDVKTYLGPDDLPHLAERLGAAGPIGDDTEVEVYADSLRNILGEIDLLRHRLAMAKNDQN